MGNEGTLFTPLLYFYLFNQHLTILRHLPPIIFPPPLFLDRVFKRHNAALAEGKPGYKTGMAFSFSPGVGAEGILLKQI